MATTVFDTFGVGQMPWIIRVYLLLFFATILLMLMPGFAWMNFSEESQHAILEIGKDSLKVITGAVIGSLTMAGNREWGKGHEPPDVQDTDRQSE